VKLTHSSTPIAEARALFGPFLLTPEDVGRLLSVTEDQLAGDPSALAGVPYSKDALEAGRARGDFLVFRTDSDGSAPLTLLRMLQRFPETVQPQLLKGVGYQLKDEWTVAQEPFAANATCRPGWRLVHGSPVASTCNLNYEQQEVALGRYAQSIGLAGSLSRRSAIETAYDTILLKRAHGEHLLEHAWDWSETPTQDGGFVTVGGFGADGLRIVGYSRAVRFGTLGICPQY
jgi:hypothetical protein